MNKTTRAPKFTEFDDKFTYDPSISYRHEDFHKLSVLKLQSIASALQIRNVKRYMKEQLITLVVQKHEQRMNSVLCETHEHKENEVEELNPALSFTEQLKNQFTTISHYKYNNQIWFKASSVANFLEYENTKKAVSDHVSADDKVLFREISLQGVPIQVPCEELHPDTVYINKYGIFDLITKSRMPLARQFRKWLVEEILPSIIDTGAYVSPALTQRQLVELQAKLEQIETQNQQLQLQVRNESQIRSNKISRNQLHNTVPLDELYILTTRKYAQDYIYKIGKSSNTPKRLKSLNTARIKDDELYICHVSKCYDANSAETHIHTLLDRYRLQNTREFFVMEFEDIRELMNHVCQNYKADYDKCIQIISNSQTRTLPEINLNIPPPFTQSNEESKSRNVITNYYNREV